MVQYELRNHVQEKLSRDEVVASVTVRLVQNPAIASLAAAAGFDTLYVDLEHCAHSMETTSEICVAGLRAGITPFVRVPEISTAYVSRALDGGALGIIAPHVERAEDAEQVVELCKHPPKGKRSEAGPLPHFGYFNPPIADSHKILSSLTTVIIMIESGAALERIDEIAAVEGVDMLFIGSNDLCADLGIAGKFDDPRLMEAFEKTIEATRSRGKHTGIGGLGGRPDLTKAIVDKGARYVSTGADLGFLAAACRKEADFVRSLRG